MMEIIHYTILKLVLNAVENVGYPYFKVLASDSPKKVLEREKIFCYELYHRMRQIQDNYCKDLTLNSEYDRFRALYKRNEMPDFLFYISETDYSNTAIIEVRNTRQMMENDIHKIEEFINQNKCKMGISLIYSKTFSSVEKYIKGNDELYELKNKENIFIIAASDPAHIKCKSLMEITGG